MVKVVLIRGNSGSGKTTVAKELHNLLGNGNLLISQDVVRREILKVRDRPQNLAVGLIETMLSYGIQHCEYVIVEGILANDKYGEMLRTALSKADEVFAYYYDLSFEETLARHSTRKKRNFEVADMERWYLEKDFLGIKNEQVIDKNVSIQQMLAKILNDLGFQNDDNTLPKTSIRLMEEVDIPKLKAGFEQQGWERELSLFEKYYQEQVNHERFVVVAEIDNELAGYATLMKKAIHGPFAQANLPEINDFNVFEKFQRHGIGNQILAKCEDIASQFSETITIGVGMHPGYGPAQRLYVKRGYIPDGSGVWFQEKVLPMNADCKNDDSLALYFSKKVRK